MVEGAVNQVRQGIVTFFKCRAGLDPAVIHPDVTQHRRRAYLIGPPMLVSSEPTKSFQAFEFAIVIVIIRILPAGCVQIVDISADSRAVKSVKLKGITKIGNPNFSSYVEPIPEGSVCP